MVNLTRFNNYTTSFDYQSYFKRDGKIYNKKYRKINWELIIFFVTTLNREWCTIILTKYKKIKKIKNQITNYSKIQSSIITV